MARLSVVPAERHGHMLLACAAVSPGVPASCLLGCLQQWAWEQMPQLIGAHTLTPAVCRCAAAAAAGVGLQLEDVDTVHMQDVFRLAAQHAQRRSRKERQQRQQQQQDKQDGPAALAAVNAGAAAVSSSSTSRAQQQQQGNQDEQQPEQQQQGQQDGRLAQQDGPTAGKQLDGNAMDVDVPASSGGNAEVPVSPTAAKGTANQEASRHSGEGSAGDGSERGSTPAPGKACNGTASALAVLPPGAGCVVAGSPGVPPGPELLLPPYKLGPKPDVLKGMWEDIQKVGQAAAGASERCQLDGGRTGCDACGHRRTQHTVAAGLVCA